MRKGIKRLIIVIITIVLMVNYINISLASAMEDYKFVVMMEGLDRKTIENEKKKLKKNDMIEINGIRMYKDLSSINIDKIAVAVNIKLKTMTIWAYNNDTEEYNIPVRTIVCSPNTQRTPRGLFHITRFINAPFHEMFGENNFCQYCMRITAQFLIHSPIFEERDHNTLKTYSYNGLGTKESGGCVRVKTGDAAWLFEHMDEESPVYIYSSDYRGPLLVERLDLIEEKQKFDPTDPYFNEKN